MLNIEQELEFGRGYERYVPRNLRLDGEIIICDAAFKETPGRTYDYGWRFNAKTGVSVGQEASDDPLRLRPKSATVPVPQFFLFAGHREWGKDGWVKIEAQKFATPQEAAEEVKRHNGLFSSSLSPFRIMMRKEIELSEVKDYPSWAAFRFESGEWLRLPWADEEWAKTDETQHHFAHLSVMDNCQVAFWDGEYHAQMDTITVMAPGRYLKRFYGDVLNDTQIRDWAVKVDVECQLKLTFDPEEMVEIYTRYGAPSSCMKYSDDSDSWTGKMNPVRVYGAGDLALAYLERKGKVVARALVWPDKMIAGRRYGDIERLTDQLKVEGYTMDSEDSSASGRGTNFNGARIKLMRPEVCRNQNLIIMPYVDAGYKASVIEGDDKHLVLDTNGSICTTYTNGISFLDPHGDTDYDENDPDYDYHCYECGDGGYDDDGTYVEGRGTYCEGCADRYTFTCQAPNCGGQHHNNNRYTVLGSDGDAEAWCHSCRENNATLCDYCNEDVVTTFTVHDATYDQDDEPDHHADACQSCLDNDDAIQRDVNNQWIDVSTATHCGDCESYFGSDAEQCPNSDCTSNQNQTQELEAA